MDLRVVISCEHASNEIPAEYQYLFKGAEDEVNSHKGWDPGSLQIANLLGKAFGIEPYIYPYCRLLIEPNRSLNSEQLFSRFTQVLDLTEKSILIQKYYQPYRKNIEVNISHAIMAGPVLHLGIHTFTPIWNGLKREVDVGVLFDPGRMEEDKFSNQLIEAIKDNGSELQIRANEPYKGTDDGFTTYLRKIFAVDDYLGLEIEINQGLADRSVVVSHLLKDSLQVVMEKFKNL